MQKKKEYSVLGIMSGTSLDGVDLALCHFNLFDSKWSYSIEKALTIPYNSEWRNKLTNAHLLNAVELFKLDREYGEFLGTIAKNFLENKSIDFIASHGHTVFHQPTQKFTVQLGHGGALAAQANCTVINDFRSADVALGGNGAPLVPIGDELLFNTFDYCLNLGGFANISYKKNQVRLAYDICPVNIILNKLCPPYDENGNNGRKGIIIPDLLRKLNNIAFYRKNPPKSLGREWLEQNFLHLLNNENYSQKDVLHTIYEHISTQISVQIVNANTKTVLLTGGGTYNNFLIECIKAKSSANFIIPDTKTIDFKEALIFAFLGVLRIRNEVNCLASVTGAYKDNVGGAIWQLSPVGT